MDLYRIGENDFIALLRQSLVHASPEATRFYCYLQARARDTSEEVLDRLLRIADNTMTVRCTVLLENNAVDRFLVRVQACIQFLHDGASNAANSGWRHYYRLGKNLLPVNRTSGKGSSESLRPFPNTPPGTKSSSGLNLAKNRYAGARSEVLERYANSVS